MEQVHNFQRIIQSRAWNNTADAVKAAVQEGAVVVMAVPTCGDEGTSLSAGSLESLGDPYSKKVVGNTDESMENFPGAADFNPRY